MGSSLAAEDLVEDTTGADVLIQNAQVRVTREEFEAYVNARVPEGRRKDVLSRPGAVREMLANLFVMKALADEARRAAWYNDPDTQIRLRIAEDLQLSELALARAAHVEQDLDWDLLAQERYVATRDSFRVPDRIRASHILISSTGRTQEEAEARAGEVFSRLARGEPFETLAAEYSEDPSVAQNAGSLGVFTQDRMVPEFGEAAFGLTKVGELAGPVKTQFGWHVIRLDEKLPGSVRPFEAVRDEIVRELRAERSTRLRQAEISRVRSMSDIQVHEEQVEALEQALRQQ